MNSMEPRAHWQPFNDLADEGVALTIARCTERRRSSASADTMTPEFARYRSGDVGFDCGGAVKGGVRYV